MPSSNNTTAQGFTQTELEIDEPNFESLKNAIKLENLKFREVELGEFLGQFCVGITLEEEQLTTFSLVPPTTKLDRALGSLLSANANKLISVLPQYLPELIDTVGGYSFKDLAKKLSTSPSQLVQGMAMGDLLLLILNARIKARDGDGAIEMAVKCINCGHLNKDTPDSCHDLKTISVKVPPKHEGKFIVEVNLSDGFRVGKDLVTKVYMEPLKLYQVKKITDPTPGSPEDITALTYLITEIPEAEDYQKIKGRKFSVDDYDNLTLRDAKILKKAVQELVPGMPGPAINLEMICSNCGNEWEAAPAWADLRNFLFGTDQTA